MLSAFWFCMCYPYPPPTTPNLWGNSPRPLGTRAYPSPQPRSLLLSHQHPLDLQTPGERPAPSGERTRTRPSPRPARAAGVATRPDTLACPISTRQERRLHRQGNFASKTWIATLVRLQSKSYCLSPPLVSPITHPITRQGSEQRTRPSPRPARAAARISITRQGSDLPHSRRRGRYQT
jgi:hypothetical protein